jgi:hypothetical protein
VAAARLSIRLSAFQLDGSFCFLLPTASSPEMLIHLLTMVEFNDQDDSDTIFNLVEDATRPDS